MKDTQNDWEEKYRDQHEKLMEKADLIFENTVSIDDGETKDDLKIIRLSANIKSLEREKISSTLILNYETITNKKDLKDLCKYIDLHANTIENCIDFAKESQNEIFQTETCNIKVITRPDHAFNLFIVNNKVYFYDSWNGGLLGEFTQEFFYTHCYLGESYEINRQAKEAVLSFQFTLIYAKLF